MLARPDKMDAQRDHVTVERFTAEGAGLVKKMIRSKALIMPQM